MASERMFSPALVGRAFRDRGEDRIGVRGPRVVALTATDKGELWSVEHGWVSPSSGAAPFVSFGMVTVGNTPAHIDTLFRDCRATAFASDHPFDARLFQPFAFTHVDLGDLRSLAEARLAGLLAQYALSLPPFGHGLKEALSGHTATKRLASPALRLVLVAASGYTPRSISDAVPANFGGIVGSNFNVETMTVGSVSGEGGVGGRDDLDFTRRLVQSMPKGTFR